jgi:hypothetical protein
VSAEVVLAFVMAMAVLREDAAADVRARAAAISLVNVEILLMAWSVLSTIAILLLYILLTWVVRELLSPWNSLWVVFDKILKLLERMAKLPSRLWAVETIFPLTVEIVNVDKLAKLESKRTILVLNS